MRTAHARAPSHLTAAFSRVECRYGVALVSRQSTALRITVNGKEEACSLN